MMRDQNGHGRLLSEPGFQQTYERLSSSEETTPFAPGYPQTLFPTSAPGSGWGQRLIKPATPLPALPPYLPGDRQSQRGLDVSRQPKKSIPVFASIISLVALLGSLAFVALRLANAGQAVTLYQVGAQNFTQYVGGGGIIFPRQQLDISYPVSERVVSVFVHAGDGVSLNQPLIQLDPQQLNIQIKQAADEVAAAAAYLDSVSASGTPVSIAQAQQQYNLAKSRYNALLAQSSSPFMRNGNVIAPMTGVVTSVDVNPGEVFAPATPLLTIMDESAVIVHVKIPLASLGQVHSGQSALVTPAALPGLTLHGTVISLIPRADPQTDTFEIWVEVNNSARNLLPGMSAFVRIEDEKHAIGVPRMAVLDPDSTPAVFVVRDQHAYLQTVHIAGRSVDAIFVDAGLSDGDRIVLIGLDELKNGQFVRPEGVQGAPRLAGFKRCPPAFLSFSRWCGENALMYTGVINEDDGAVLVSR